MRDLVLLVADNMIGQGVSALLGRIHALGISDVDFELLVHPDNDPGCYHGCVDLLRSFTKRYQYALVVFDLHGCGAPGGRVETEADVEARLNANGWEGNASAVVIDPELEVWFWSDSPEIEAILRWTRPPSLREWLADEGLWADGAAKPADPKKALGHALRHLRAPPSAALFEKAGSRVSVKRCVDPAFNKLTVTLTNWFAA